jgi:hypothetical protein
MVRIGTVWDRTVDVLQGRSRILTGLAALYILLPNVLMDGFAALATPGTTAALLAGLGNLISLVALIFGVLAMTAVATDPSVGAGEAGGIARERLGPALAVLLVILVAAVITMLPAGAALGMAGARMVPGGRLDVTTADPGSLAGAGVLGLVTLVVALWLSARLVPLFPVVVNERHGLRAIPRAFRLSRGTALRLIGVTILYGVVLIVVAGAVTSVVGVIARLLIGGAGDPGADAGVGFVVGVAGAIVTAGATVLQTVFYAQFYIAARTAAGEDVLPAA